jgi:GAF domain-containing protein
MRARVAEMLRQGRRYTRVEISRRTEDAGTNDAGADGRAGADRVTSGTLRVPIRAGGKSVGVIDVECDRPEPFGDEDRSIIERLAALLAGPLGGPAA